jgi:trimeric autotransporter adhesin
VRSPTEKSWRDLAAACALAVKHISHERGLQTKQKRMTPMKTKSPFFPIALVLVCVAISSVTQARQLSEDRGNGNSAAEGVDALIALTTGISNTAHGWQSLYGNTEGTYNTADGFQALFSNTTGGANTANGWAALYSNTTGDLNIAIGQAALANNTTGSDNIALGIQAGQGISTANNVIAIGHSVGQNVSNSCYIGNIFGATSPAGTAVFINTDGRLGTATSSRRFKEDVKPMARASEAVFALKPVTFRYKKDLDPAGIPQFGLAAEEVEDVNPDLVVRDGEGKVNTVRYEAINAMLLNEFLKEHREVQELRASDAEQKNEIAELRRQLKQQAEAIRKVSDRVELDSSKQLIANQR